MKPSVYIYMKPYLVEFAKCKMGNGLFSNTEIIIKIVKPFLRRGANPGSSSGMPGDHLAKLAIPLPLINDLYIGDNKVYISEADHKNIARIFEAHFNDALFCYVSDKYRYHGELKKCFYQFCADHDIAFENINYEMMLKKYYRFRRKKEAKTSFITSQSVRNLSATFLFML